MQKERSLGGKAEREKHPSVVFQTIVVSQQYCSVFCPLEELKDSFDCQEHLVLDIVICLSGNELLRKKGTGMEFPLRADLLREG